MDQLETEGTERWLLTYIMIAIAREKIRKLIVKTWPKTLVGLPQAEDDLRIPVDDDIPIEIGAHHVEPDETAALKRYYPTNVLVTGWDTAKRKQPFRRRRGRVYLGLAISPAGKVLAVAQGGCPGKGPKVPAGQGPIRLEDLATGEELVTFPVVKRQTQPLAFSPDGRLLATYTLGPAPSVSISWQGLIERNAHTAIVYLTPVSASVRLSTHSHRRETES